MGTESKGKKRLPPFPLADFASPPTSSISAMLSQKTPPIAAFSVFDPLPSSGFRWWWRSWATWSKDTSDHLVKFSFRLPFLSLQVSGKFFHLSSYLVSSNAQAPAQNRAFWWQYHQTRQANALVALLLVLDVCIFWGPVELPSERGASNIFMHSR